MAVQSVLGNLGIEYLTVELGRVRLAADLTPAQKDALDAGLRYYSLELMANKKLILVEQIKLLIIQKFQAADQETGLKFSVYLSNSLQYDYTYLANIFSEIEGSTIERFFITSRIERVKELMVYETLSIKEIAFQLNYSSVSHLCLQFKKVTGHTPSVFKKLCNSTDFIWRTCE